MVWWITVLYVLHPWNRSRTKSTETNTKFFYDIKYQLLIKLNWLIKKKMFRKEIKKNQNSEKRRWFDFSKWLRTPRWEKNNLEKVLNTKKFLKKRTKKRWWKIWIFWVVHERIFLIFKNILWFFKVFIILNGTVGA